MMPTTRLTVDDDERADVLLGEARVQKLMHRVSGRDRDDRPLP